MKRIAVYDTTLRDGAQREGISLSARDKMKIARKLDELGVAYIEGGWPGSNPKDVEFFLKAHDLKLENARISAFGSTRRKGIRCEDDPNLKALIDAGTPVVAIVGKSWELHVTHVLETSREENLAMIRESVAYMKGAGKEVIYDAEHFYDGYLDDADYAVATLLAAEEGGADSICLCDTNGGRLPWEIEEITRAVISRLGTPVSIHAHNDAGCGVANTLAGVRAGATMVQGTINGYGERVGNADLCSVIPNLQLKMGCRCVSDEQLQKLTETSRYVSEVANQWKHRHLPYVGRSAFTHKGGIHVAAMMKVEESYQHIDPKLVGNERRTIVSELSGKGNIQDKIQEFGLDANNEEVGQVLGQIKELEAQGFTFEGAEASVDLLLRRVRPGYRPPFELVDFMTLVEHRQGRGMFSEATLKVRVGERVMHTVGEGNGPVNALDAALRKALVDVYPKLATVHLTDYKVRILDSDAGTAAQTRVMIDSHNGKRGWTTVGASTNVIAASWLALSDSLEYAIIINGDWE